MNDRFIAGGTLSLACPEGFHVMTADELAKMNFFGGETGEGMTAPERHILITVGSKPIGGLAGMLLNAGDIARGTEARLKKPMQANGYAGKGFCSAAVGTEKAEGFGYEYEAEGTGMYGESNVIKRKKTLWFLHCYTRTALKQESVEIWKEILQTAEWLK